jgi:hypothetical protein
MLLRAHKARQKKKESWPATYTSTTIACFRFPMYAVTARHLYGARRFMDGGLLSLFPFAD